jgi:DNA-directed RNA polymerase alpha subunit
MKASDPFKSIIENYLQETALSDTAFASSLSKESKNIDCCINYIFSEVKKTGLCAFANEEIFDMAVKYYTDDSISPTTQINCNATVKQAVKADLFTPVATTQSIVPETVVKQAIKPTQTTLTLFDL